MLWEIEIQPVAEETDREAARVLAEARTLGAGSISRVQSARSFLIEGNLDEAAARDSAAPLLADGVVESVRTRRLPAQNGETDGSLLLNVLLRPGVTDNVGQTAAAALRDLVPAVEVKAAPGEAVPRHCRDPVGRAHQRGLRAPRTTGQGEDAHRASPP